MALIPMAPVSVLVSEPVGLCVAPQRSFGCRTVVCPTLSEHVKDFLPTSGMKKDLCRNAIHAGSQV